MKKIYLAGFIALALVAGMALGYMVPSSVAGSFCFIDLPGGGKATLYQQKSDTLLVTIYPPYKVDYVNSLGAGGVDIYIAK
jgi:hypothetical protein